MPTRSNHPPTLFLMLAGLFLAGCASWPYAPAVPVAPAPAPVVLAAPPDPIAAAARRLVAHQDRLRQMPAATFAEEIARLRAQAASPEITIELAMALASTRANGDLAQALQLLNSLINGGELVDEQWRALARLVVVGLNERRRQEEQIEQQAQQLRELQRKLDQVNEKLDALRAIERSLSARPIPAPRE